MAHRSRSLKESLAFSGSSPNTGGPVIPYSDIYGPPAAERENLRVRLNSNVPALTRNIVVHICRYLAPKSKSGGKWYSTGENGDKSSISLQSVKNTKLLLKLWTQRTTTIALKVADEILNPEFADFRDYSLSSLESEWSEKWEMWELDSFMEKEERRANKGGWGAYHKSEFTKIRSIGLTEKEFDAIRESARGGRGEGGKK